MLLKIKVKIIKIEKKETLDKKTHQVLYLDNGLRIINFYKYNEVMKIGENYWLAIENNKLLSWSWSQEGLGI